MCRDDWIKSAFSDDSLVAEFLVGLRTPKRRRPVLLEWGVRQPRSRQILERKKKAGSSTRASPTTPLSWSAGTSNSGGGGDGCEESSPRLTNTRSKAINLTENNTRRSRKKTFAQLKDHESFLLKEGIDLKRALATEHVLYEREKIKCESLKKLKLDLQLQPPFRPGTSDKKPTIHQSKLFEAMASKEPSGFLPSEKCNDMVSVYGVPIDFSKAQRKGSVQRECHPVLPDLNLLPDLNMPLEEDLI